MRKPDAAPNLLQLGRQGLPAALHGASYHAPILLRQQHGGIKHDLHGNPINDSLRNSPFAAALFSIVLCKYVGA